MIVVTLEVTKLPIPSGKRLRCFTRICGNMDLSVWMPMAAGPHTLVYLVSFPRRRPEPSRRAVPETLHVSFVENNLKRNLLLKELKID